MRLIYLALALLFASSCSTAYMALDSADDFEIQRYMGKWYEISRLPNKFEEGLENITANYELTDDGKVLVINEGRLISDRSRVKQAKGRAWIPDPSEPSKLKVSFFWPFAGDYWVLKVDKDYTYALVGDPSGKFLWILARDPKIDPKIEAALKEYAFTLGFPVENMVSGQAD
jgi:apolipoprotein D and lipocalin family protein